MNANRTRKKTALKILALAAALLLMALLAFLANAFVGNPLSAWMARRDIVAYLQAAYPQQEWQVEKARYNFKFGEYTAQVQSPDSEDTHFAVYWRGGRVKHDDYGTYVTDRWNTRQRLEESYSAEVIPLLQAVPGLEGNRSMVTLGGKGSASEAVVRALPLDVPFSKSLSDQWELTIRADWEDDSLPALAEMFEAAHQKLTTAGCTFARYHFFTTTEEGATIMIDGLTPADIESGELLARLETAQREGEAREEEERRQMEESGGRLEKGEPLDENRLTVYIHRKEG